MDQYTVVADSSAVGDADRYADSDAARTDAAGTHADADDVADADADADADTGSAAVDARDTCLKLLLALLAGAVAS